MINVGTQGTRAVGLTPTYDVVPGEGVGIFQLGDNLWHVLELIRTHKTEYPKVEVLWDEESPNKSAVVIHLPHLTLYFPPSPLYQILSIISISIPHSGSRSTNLELTYETQVLSSTHMPLTRARVGRLMGPTFISKSGDKLDFPGITFNLNPSTSLGDTDSFGPREDIVNNITIQPRQDEELQPKLISCVIQPSKGITLALDEDNVLPIIIGETTSQDLMLDLGSPLRKFWKEDDRLEKMWGGSKASTDGACFWNYFQYGLDFLISKDGFVIKILCHSNIPGTPSFQRYARCPWLIPSSSGQLNLTSSSNAFRTHFSSSDSSQQYIDEIRLTVPEQPKTPSPAISDKEKTGINGSSGSGNGKKKKRNGSSSNVVISESETTKNEEVHSDQTKKNVKSTESSKEDHNDAMMLDRLVEGGLDGISNLSPSKLIGFDGLIVEEDEKSGGICSVLIYKD
ncbi:uncharacterized protein L201_004193 [Kwoniella dendrophila CBS 6074]|uniref:Uncharacterized protein n=1 Tax=Kwoniella dendrophila CBS 6074 TaxID=1295534 RepID=A0AAX4JV69_9TREE